MKKLMTTVVMSCALAVLITGCCGILPQGAGTMGGLYTQVSGAIAPAGQTTSVAKVGTSESTAIIGIATGDSSISKAMENGAITKINHVDCKVTSVLGVYVKYTTVVYGE